MREKKDVLYVVQGLEPIGGVTGKKTHPAELPQSAASRDELVSALAVGEHTSWLLVEGAAEQHKGC